MRALALAVLLFAACGTVTADPRDAGAGAGGQLLAAGGQGGHAGDVAGASGSAGTPTTSTGGTTSTSTGGAGGAACLSSDAPGLAFNTSEPCVAGDAATCDYKSGRCCYARCTLNGAPFVGCVSGSTVASRCYASCSDCP